MGRDLKLLVCLATNSEPSLGPQPTSKAPKDLSAYVKHR